MENNDDITQQEPHATSPLPPNPIVEDDEDVDDDSAPANDPTAPISAPNNGESAAQTRLLAARRHRRHVRCAFFLGFFLFWLALVLGILYAFFGLQVFGPKDDPDPEDAAAEAFGPPPSTDVVALLVCCGAFFLLALGFVIIDRVEVRCAELSAHARAQAHAAAHGVLTTAPV